MAKNTVQFKKLFSSSDIVTIAIIALGFILAIFVEELAFRLIGISLSILGVVRLIMFIAQRVNAMIESNQLRPSNPPIDFKVTEKKDRKAKRVVIEDYSTIRKTEKKSGKEEKYKDKIVEEEGFRVIDSTQEQIADMEKKSLDIEKPIINIDKIETSKSKSKVGNYEEKVFEFEEDISSVKIIGNADKDEIVVDKKSKNLEGNIESQFDIIEESKDKDVSSSYIEKKIDIPLSELVDTDPAFGLEPRKEFEYFLLRVLKLIRSVSSTKTAVFLLVNAEKRELIVEAYDSNVPELIASRKRLPFGNDIVSQIVENLKPQILTEINPNAELDLIPYYISKVGTSSFLGMPVFYKGIVVGVICVDTDISNAYDISIVELFGHFSKLIGGLVQSYTEKYDLLQDSKTLESISIFRNMVNEGNITLENINKAVITAVSNRFEDATIGIIEAGGKGNDWFVTLIKMAGRQETESINAKIVVNSSLAYKSLNSTETILFTPITKDTLRVYDGEPVYEDGYFISVPLKSSSNIYGAIFVEGANASEVLQYDLKILETLGEHAGTTIEQFHFSNIIKNSSLYDPYTGLLNTPAFVSRLAEEYARSQDFAYPLTICLVKIDKYKSFDPEHHFERSEQVLLHVTQIIKKKIRPYDIIGRADSNVFGIILIDVNISDAKIWAEMLRSDIAISVIKIGSDRFNVTISLGLAPASSKDDVDRLLSNANKVLNISSTKTNTVSVFE